MFDVSEPRAPAFLDWVSTRNYSVEPGEGNAGDSEPEGLAIVPEEDSPTGTPLLAVAYEVSGTTRLFELRRMKNLTARMASNGHRHLAGGPCVASVMAPC